jgi:TRAP-type C4-dicarboxylate transport system permease large subunit
VPTQFAEWVSTTLQHPFLIILAMNVLVLLVGMPLDLPPAILLFAPIFVPLAATIGLDPVQLGLIMVQISASASTRRRSVLPCSSLPL